MNALDIEWRFNRLCVCWFIAATDHMGFGYLARASTQRSANLQECAHTTALCVESIRENTYGNIIAGEGPAHGNHFDCGKQSPDVGQQLES